MKETVTEARMRVLACLLPIASARGGSVLGRLYLDPRNRLDEGSIQAGVRMGEISRGTTP